MSVSLSIQLITVSLITLQRQYSHDLTVSRNTWSDSYDYIVVGAGSGGAVVARRLAKEQPNGKVLLLEAGGAQNLITDTPALYGYQFNSLWDWNYTTVPQTGFGWSQNSIIGVTAGKVIGGTSSINGMVYNRGNKRGYNEWVSKYGCTGWGYNDVLPFFILSENNTDPTIVSQNARYHGTKGLVKISSDPNPDPILNYCVQAFNQIGYKTVDFNGAQQLGTSIVQSFIYDGIRTSVGNAYIDPNFFPNYLHIVAKALVIRVLMRQTTEGLKAFGVQFIRDNKLYEVKANKEIIISAGAVGSPKLLMLSGVGPKDHLQQKGIPVLQDLPVGNNFKDHIILSFDFGTLRAGVPHNPIANTDIQQWYLELTQGTGPLSRFSMTNAYMNTKSNRDKQWPNFFNGMRLSGLIGDGTQYHNRTAQWVKFYQEYSGKLSFNLFIQNVKAKSVGTLRLASHNPLDYPLIDPRYMSDPQDLADMVEMVKIIYQFLLKSSINKYVNPILKPIPGCEPAVCPNTPITECDPYISCFVRTLSGADYHFSGACRMGAITRADVVVDPTLKVKGIVGLRVCDASVMPQIPNANTNAASIMIGERCSKFIINSK